MEGEPAPFPIPIKPVPRSVVFADLPEVTTAPVSPGRYRIDLNSPPTSQTWPDTGITLSRERRETVELAEGQPNSSHWHQEATNSWSRGDWRCTVTALIDLTSTPTEFILSEHLTAWEGDIMVFEQRVDRRIDRNLI